MDAMVKICPMCSYNNPVDAVFCEECDNDLSRVPVSASAQAATSSGMANTPSTAPTEITNQLSAVTSERKPRPIAQTGRQCKCGWVSPLRVMVCQNCGESLATAPIVRKENSPTHVPATSSESVSCSWVLVSTDNEASLSITDGQHLLIGWAGELGGYLKRARKEYVSNRHGMLSVVRGELFFEDNSSNGTLINDRPITKGQAQKLSVGDILCLGGLPGTQMAPAAYFRIEKR